MQRTSKVVACSVAGLTTFIAFAVGLSTMSGCGPEKELPKPPQTDPRDGKQSTGTIPTQAEEKAQKVVDRAIRAMTDGHPERLERTKVNRSTAKGLFKTFVQARGRLEFVETNREFRAVYPDRVRVDYDFKDQGSQTIGLRRPAGAWTRIVPGQLPPFDPQQFSENVAIDALGTHWLLTLTPLTDTKTVVYGLSATSVSGHPFDTVKVVVPGYPVVFTLWFDQASGLLTRVEFTNLEGGAPVSKVIVLSDPKSFGGLKLPSTIAYTRDGQDAERWTVETWEFPNTISDEVFTEPK